MHPTYYFKKILFYIPRRIKQKIKFNLMLNFYSKFIEKDSICFDIGSNLGNRTDVFRHLAKNVIAIEPQKTCIEILQNKFSKYNVTVVETALGSNVGESEIFFDSEKSVIATMSDQWKNEGRFKSTHFSHSQKVRVTTLDILIEKYGLPSFCKIDVEGFELEVINGLSKPIPNISFEFTIEFLDNAKKCMKKLSAIGKYKFNYSVGESMKLKLNEWADDDAVLDSIKNSSVLHLWGDIYAKKV